MPVLDILHRGVVLACIGTTFWGIGMGVAVHNDTMRRGRGTSHFLSNSLSLNLSRGKNVVLWFPCR
ncbi:hypothetical protein K488DRAFT_53966 [Vararia minispora EC-137]|uniref:Uncharacterized protein n=1 Tax=Vararia minispora EC-137 TaxID=1314806 RepID=A0ACB8QFI9_9AGAM|nr:hypothetical protein K488DRAFT_53966 [Vararia minispora EC-137]